MRRRRGVVQLETESEPEPEQPPAPVVSVPAAEERKEESERPYALETPTSALGRQAPNYSEDAAGEREPLPPEQPVDDSPPAEEPGAEKAGQSAGGPPPPPEPPPEDADADQRTWSIPIEERGPLETPEPPSPLSRHRESDRAPPAVQLPPGVGEGSDASREAPAEPEAADTGQRGRGVVAEELAEAATQRIVALELPGDAAGTVRRRGAAAEEPGGTDIAAEPVLVNTGTSPTHPRRRGVLPEPPPPTSETPNEEGSGVPTSLPKRRIATILAKPLETDDSETAPPPATPPARRKPKAIAETGSISPKETPRLDQSAVLQFGMPPAAAPKELPVKKKRRGVAALLRESGRDSDDGDEAPPATPPAKNKRALALELANKKHEASSAVPATVSPTSSAPRSAMKKRPVGTPGVTLEVPKDQARKRVSFDAGVKSNASPTGGAQRKRQSRGGSPAPSSPASPSSPTSRTPPPGDESPGDGQSRRRKEREEESYRSIFGYMERQLSYMKRKVMKTDNTAQTHLQLPLDVEVDEVCLRDVAMLLAEDARRRAAGEHAEFYFPRCLLKSKRLVAVLNSISGQAARMLDAGIQDTEDAQAERTAVAQAAVLRQKILAMEEEHRLELGELHGRLADEREHAEQALTEHFEHETQMRISRMETRYREREIRTQQAHKEQTTRLQSDLRLAKESRDRMANNVRDLEDEVTQLRSCVETRNAELLNVKKRHRQFDLVEKERAAEALLRSAVATATAVERLTSRQQIAESDKEKLCDIVERVRAAATEREIALQQALELARDKIASLQSKHAAVLREHVVQCAEQGEAIQRIAEGSRKVAEKIARGTELAAAQTHSVTPTACRPLKPTSLQGWKEKITEEAEQRLRLVGSAMTWRSYHTHGALGRRERQPRSCSACSVRTRQKERVPRAPFARQSTTPAMRTESPDSDLGGGCEEGWRPAPPEQRPRSTAGFVRSSVHLPPRSRTSLNTRAPAVRRPSAS